MDTQILDELGYGAHMGTRLFGVSGIGGRLPSYELPMFRFTLMGLELTTGERRWIIINASPIRNVKTDAIE